jgi:hypothetical protein
MTTCLASLSRAEHLQDPSVDRNHDLVILGMNGSKPSPHCSRPPGSSTSDCGPEPADSGATAGAMIYGELSFSDSDCADEEAGPPQRHPTRVRSPSWPGNPDSDCSSDSDAPPRPRPQECRSAAVGWGTEDSNPLARLLLEEVWRVAAAAATVAPADANDPGSAGDVPSSDAEGCMDAVLASETIWEQLGGDGGGWVEERELWASSQLL